MTVKVTPRGEISADLRALPSADLRREALTFIVRLRQEPYLGQPLGIHPVIGDLSDCRKIFFDQARYRILYRLLPSDQRPQEADVIAVGARAAFAVYNAAIQRLGR
jgi:hypothetical protein